MYYSDFNIDPLTGLPNIFSLLECDISTLCNEYGTVIAFDLIGLNRINQTYGHSKGDLYLKSLVDVFKDHLEADFSAGTAHAFRLGGDEFILLLPLKPQSYALDLFESIRTQFNKILMENNIAEGGLRIAILPYSKMDTSATLLLKWVNRALSAEKSNNTVSYQLPGWADNMIEGMVTKIRETLLMLREAHKLAHSDDVSGLPNHRAAQDFLRKVKEDFANSGIPFSLLFIDGDNLRQYNELGYQRGNEMIHDLSALVTRSVRREDRVFRWLSGDEFLVVLPKTGNTSALQIAERIRSTIEAGTKEWPFPITVSIGAVSCPQDGTVINELLYKSEKAVTLAKNSGKNRVARVSPSNPVRQE